LLSEVPFSTLPILEVDGAQVSDSLYFFVIVPYFTPYIFTNFQIEQELGSGINPSIAFTPFLSNTLDETRFEPTTFRE
jgi:hypothetical protein